VNEVRQAKVSYDKNSPFVNDISSVCRVYIFSTSNELALTFFVFLIFFYIKTTTYSVGIYLLDMYKMHQLCVHLYSGLERYRGSSAIFYVKCKIQTTNTRDSCLMM